MSKYWYPILLILGNKRILLFFVCLLVSTALAAQNVKVIGKQIEYATLPRYTVVNEASLALASYQPCYKDAINLKLNDSLILLKLNLGKLDSTTPFAIKINNPNLDKLELLVLQNGVSVYSQHTGDSFLFSHRKYDHTYFVFDIPYYSNASYYLALSSRDQLDLPVIFGTQQNVLKQASREDYFSILLLSIIAIMFCYNLFLYVSIRDPLYFFYSFYILTIGLAQASIHGFGYFLLWGNHIWLQQHAIYIFSGLSGVFLVEFIIRFIEKKNISIFNYRSLRIVQIGYGLSIPLAFTNLFHFTYQLLQVLALVGVVFVLIVAISAARKKVASANYFLLAYTVFLVGLFFFVLKDLGIIPYSTIAAYTLPAGVGLEAILLSFALAHRIKLLQQSKTIAQDHAIELARKNEELIKTRNEDLSKQVAERTTELEQALTNLKKSEAELVNREKMSSLGVLTAGIAHEINNPINFVTASVRPLKKDINGLVQLHTAYKAALSSNNLEQHLPLLQAMEQKLDIDYTIQEIRDLMEGIEEGATRTAAIVKGLQNFSSSDARGMHKADINEGIRNTLTILGSITKGNIDVETSLAELPVYYCNMGQVNQVFLNIINNAIHAVEHNAAGNRKIKVESTCNKDWISIAIADNGCGMSEAIQKNIFDPFYTTKEVGKGTGLGLSICQGIIENHKGFIELVSQEGLGTTFTIKLPAQFS